MAKKKIVKKKTLRKRIRGMRKIRTAPEVKTIAKKRTLIRKLEKQVVEQEKERTELEDSEELTGQRIDVVKAPGIDVEGELKKRWKHEETERELEETDEAVAEGLGIEKEEEAGEEAYPEIEKAIKEDADEATGEEEKDEEEKE